MENREKVFIYTDGSSFQDIGSWAYIAVTEDDTVIRKDGQAFEKATNNRAELYAVINALKSCNPKKDLIEIVSDSAYIVNCFLQKWYQTWETNNWHNSQGVAVKNADLWKELLSIARKFKTPVIWTHVRGHQGNAFNEEVDRLCTTIRRNYHK